MLQSIRFQRLSEIGRSFLKKKKKGRGGRKHWKTKMKRGKRGMEEKIGKKIRKRGE